MLSWYLNYLLGYWKRKNVAFVGSTVWTEIITKFHNPVPYIDTYKRIYESLAGHRYGGCFQEFKPQFFIRDPDLIRKILSTDFDHFRDRGNTRYAEHDPLSNHLFSAPGNLWKSEYRYTKRPACVSILLEL
jgi:cytochrome P450 family 6